VRPKAAIASLSPRTGPELAAEPRVPVERLEVVALARSEGPPPPQGSLGSPALRNLLRWASMTICDWKGGTSSSWTVASPPLSCRSHSSASRRVRVAHFGSTTAGTLPLTSLSLSVTIVGATLDEKRHEAPCRALRRVNEDMKTGRPFRNDYDQFSSRCFENRCRYVTEGDTILGD
jgi:hypothetical protein